MRDKKSGRAVRQYGRQADAEMNVKAWASVLKGTFGQMCNKAFVDLWAGILANGQYQNATVHSSVDSRDKKEHGGKWKDKLCMEANPRAIT